MGERPPPESQRRALSAYPLQRGRPPQRPLVSVVGRPGGVAEDGACESSHYYCGMSVPGGQWGEVLYQYLMSAEVADIYRYHGLESLRGP